MFNIHYAEFPLVNAFTMCRPGFQVRNKYEITDPPVGDLPCSCSGLATVARPKALPVRGWDESLFRQGYDELGASAGARSDRYLSPVQQHGVLYY